MQELRIISENKDNIVINWNKSDIAEEYIVEGLTNNFSYISVGRTKNCTYICDKNKNLLGYRVAYIINSKKENNLNQDYILDTTNVINIKATEVKPIKIISIKAPYNQISMSFRSEEHFDFYRLFNQKGELVTESEDCIVLGDFNDESYYVEGYNKIDDRYTIAGLSEITHCEPINNVSANNLILSIVIPVYNCETFLARTVQSVLSSTFTDFEIILVDDCSNQITHDLCDWYESNFDCIRVIHKEKRERTSAGRNTGTEAAKAEWLSYVDSDDIVHPYMYEKLYKAAIEYNSEIAISQCLMRENYNDTKKVLALNTNENIIVMNSFKEVMENQESQRNLYFVAVWNKIVKTELARKVKFNEKLHIYEDQAYTQSLYSYINKFVLVKDAYYVWDKRKQKTEGTLSNTYNDKPGDLIWVDYILACAGPLFDGNPDKEIADIYKLDFLKNILTKYSTTDAKDIKNIITGLVKYLVRTHDIPVEDLKNKYNNQNLYTIWQEIKNSNIREYDGVGPVPLEYKL